MRRSVEIISVSSLENKEQLARVVLKETILLLAATPHKIHGAY